MARTKRKKVASRPFLKDEITIFVNSSGRANYVKVTEQMPQQWKEFCFLVVPSDEYYEYQKHNDWPVLRLPKWVPKYVWNQKMYTIEMLCKTRWLWFIDDDKRFMCRRDPKKTKLTISNEKDMWCMLDDILKQHRKGISLVGISQRYMNDKVEFDYAENQAIHGSWSMDVKLFRHTRVNLAPLEPFVFGDVHLNISWLKLGYKNRVFYKYAFTDPGLGAEGGVSRYRTADVMKKSSNFLAKEHFPFVTVIEKHSSPTKTCPWKGFPRDRNGKAVRTEVMVQWKKAYVQGLKRHKGISTFLDKD